MNVHGHLWKRRGNLAGEEQKRLSKVLPKKQKRLRNLFEICLGNHLPFERRAGYRISRLSYYRFSVGKFIHAVQTPSHVYSQLLLGRIPDQYETDSPSAYGKIQSIIDYVSGMTDLYALDLYRKITGMGLPEI